MTEQNPSTPETTLQGQPQVQPQAQIPLGQPQVQAQAQVQQVAAQPEIPEQPQLVPCLISEEKKAEFIKGLRKGAFSTLGLCIGICVGILFLFWLLTIKLGVIVVGTSTIFAAIGVLSPIYGIYNLIAVNVGIAKADYEFFNGVIAFATETGYRVYNLSCNSVNFPSYEKHLGDLAPGARVIVTRFRKEYGLLHSENP